MSEARRAGIPVKPPARGKASEATRHKAERDYEKGKENPDTGEKHNRRSTARQKALKRESESSASHAALSRQARSAARKRRSS